MPHLAKAAVGHIAFRHDVTRICHVHNQNLTDVYIYIQIYIDFYVHVSLGGHNMGTSHTRKLKFGMLLTQT